MINLHLSNKGYSLQDDPFFRPHNKLFQGIHSKNKGPRS